MGNESREGEGISNGWSSRLSCRWRWLVCRRWSAWDSPLCGLVPSRPRWSNGAKKNVTVYYSNFFGFFQGVIAKKRKKYDVFLRKSPPHSVHFCENKNFWKVLTNPLLCGIIFGCTKHDPLAQSVEHLTFNQVVRGSNPRCLSVKKPCILQGFFYFIRICHGFVTALLLL